MTKIIECAYIHCRRSGQSIEIHGLSTGKSKEAQWFLFKDEDKVETKHKAVADKWNALRTPPKKYRNFQIQGDVLAQYLNKEKTAFAFNGALLERDEENSIKQTGKLDLINPDSNLYFN